jgi:hypothetical protein
MKCQMHGKSWLMCFSHQLVLLRWLNQGSYIDICRCDVLGEIKECTLFIYWFLYYVIMLHLCDLVVRVPGYRSKGPGFDSRRYHIIWEIVGLERGPLSLMSTIEELLGRNSSGSALESWEYDHEDLLRWPRNTLYPQKLALTSPTSGGRSVDAVRLRTKATEFS